MKHLHLSLLLTTNVICISCMQKERSQPNTLTTQKPSAIHNQYNWQPPTCQADEPGWEFLDNIQNTNYNSRQLQPKQAQCTEEIELKPIYKTATINNTQKEKKALLQTNSLQTNDDRMQSLYQFARNLLAAEYRGTYQQISLHEGCVALIIDMNNAKNNGINEDLMAQFSYQKKESDIVYRHISKYNQPEKNIALFVPILFMLLKKYNTTTQQTGEQVPFHFQRNQTVGLKKTLSSSTQIYQKSIFANVTNVYDNVRQYPELFQFEYAVRSFVENLYESAVRTFTTYIYENDDISQKDYFDGSYKDFKSEFYTKAYNMLLQKRSIEDLYLLVQMVNQAKRSYDITHEDDLIADIAVYFSTNESAKTKLYSMFNSSYSIDNIVKRITFFCKLIKQYNTTRDYKITPTVTQQAAYTVKTFLDIPLPEHLCNNTHLDDIFYAFKEFNQLDINTTELIKLTSDQVDQLHESLTQ